MSNKFKFNVVHLLCVMIIAVVNSAQDSGSISFWLALPLMVVAWGLIDLALSSYYIVRPNSTLNKD